MDKQLNFLNIFDENDYKKDALENDPAEFDKRELAHAKQLEDFLRDVEVNKNSFELVDFEPFLQDINQYHQRFKSFRQEFEAAKPGSEKENIYKKMVSPGTEDEPEFRGVAKLYLIYLEKLKEHNAKTRKESANIYQKKKHPKETRNNTFWSTPKYDQGKDAASGAYLDYKE